jgi:hypothetical protein
MARKRPPVGSPSLPLLSSLSLFLPLLSSQTTHNQQTPPPNPQTHPPQVNEAALNALKGFMSPAYVEQRADGTRATKVRCG